MKTQKAFLILAAAIAGTSVYADKVTLEQTPPAVQQAIRARAAQRPIEDIDRDMQNGQTTYEASWKNNAGLQQELLVDQNGQIVRDVKGGKKNRGGGRPNQQTSTPATFPGFSNGQPAQLNWATETTQNQLKALANGSSLENLQKGQFHGQTAYQASYKTNGHNVTVVVGENGQLLGTTNGRISTNPSRGSSVSINGFTNPQQAPLNWASESVQNKFKQMANGSEVQNFQKGQYQGRNAFMGTVNQNGQPTTIVIAEDGTVLANAPTAVGSAAGYTFGSANSVNNTISGFTGAQQAPMNWASENVQNKFKQMSNGAEVQNFQKGQYQGRNAFMGTVNQNGQPTTVVIGEDGSVLANAPASR